MTKRPKRQAAVVDVAPTDDGATVVKAWREHWGKRGIFVGDGDLHPNVWKDLESRIDQALRAHAG